MWAVQQMTLTRGTFTGGEYCCSPGRVVISRADFVLHVSPPGVPFGFSPVRIGSFAEVPDFVVPIGQATYNSTITVHEEELPITVDFVAAKGCDGMLFQLIQQLQTVGIINAVQAGQTILGGEILL